MFMPMYSPGKVMRRPSPEKKRPEQSVFKSVTPLDLSFKNSNNLSALYFGHIRTKDVKLLRAGTEQG